MLPLVGLKSSNNNMVSVSLAQTARPAAPTHSAHQRILTARLADHAPDHASQREAVLETRPPGSV